MARFKIFSCFSPYFLQLISVFVCVLYLQLTSGTYVEQYLESAEICAHASGSSFSFIQEYSKKKVRLANFPNNTVVIRLTRWQEMWKSFYNFKCQFTVVAPKRGMGVMMVVQSMHLRHKGDSCRDFIKFKGDNDDSTSALCGDLDKTDRSKNPENMIGSQRYLASTKRGEIDGMFHIGAELKEEDGQPVSIEVVFTAISDCSSSSTAKMIADDKAKQCSPSHRMSCIPKVLYCDGKVNCGFDDGFGSDESDDSDCDAERSSSEIKRSMSIFVFAITAVTTLIIVILCTLTVCCCMRKFQKPPRNVTQNHNLDIEFHLDHTGLPSAPPLTLDRGSYSPSNTKSEDRDLPPKYEELYPEENSIPVQKKK